MSRRTLLVFAGQSNMMGACACAPSGKVAVRDSWEYVHKPRRMAAQEGAFRLAGFPCGEFTYADLHRAYADGQPLSSLTDYRQNAFFVPSMCNRRADATEPFAVYSERNHTPGPSLPPYLAQAWEARGHVCAYAHIAKGAVSILHYFDDEMLLAYREASAKKGLQGIPERTLDDMCRGASAYFQQKTMDFFDDCRKRFGQDDLSDKCLCWLQGESDAGIDAQEYQTLLEVLWGRAKRMGFTHFFCLRVGYFGKESILSVMKAQERFCAEMPDASMLTRACSLMPFAGQDEAWFLHEPQQEYQFCRDSFLGYDNQHINEKGFRLLAKRAAENMERSLVGHEPPVLEEENIRGMME